MLDAPLCPRATSGEPVVAVAVAEVAEGRRGEEADLFISPPPLVLAAELELELVGFVLRRRRLAVAGEGCGVLGDDEEGDDEEEEEEEEEANTEWKSERRSIPTLTTTTAGCLFV